MKLEFPSLTATLTPEALVLSSRQPLLCLSSAVVGGGLTETRTIINRHVDKNYLHPDPVGDLRAFAATLGIGDEPFVGLMTAVYLDRVQSVVLYEDNLTVAAIVTAGLSNPTAAGLSQPAVLTPGTINMILLVDAPLSPAAMVNAIITATEAKTDLLLQRRIPTPDGAAATGTSTDSVVVACAGTGNQIPYAGPATTVGWLIGRCVRRSLAAALEKRD